MPTVKVNMSDLGGLVGMPLTPEELRGVIESLAGELDSIQGEEASVNFEPNRPDLFSVEGIARAVRGVLEVETGLKRYAVQDARHVLTVDPSVRTVRGEVVGAFVHGVELDDWTVRSLMDFQEKIHASIGRNRRKVSIGVHDATPLEPPFTYTAVGRDDLSFIPLGWDEPLTPGEVLTRHEKGREYAWVLEGVDACPILMDSMSHVLSFPPIINGELTRITASTREMFIDVTGLDPDTCMLALTLLCCALMDRGASVECIRVIDGERTVISPDISPRQMDLDIFFVKRLLGLEVRPEACITALEKLRHDASLEGEVVRVQTPAYRCDILHPADLVEDIAIGMGYGVFTPVLPRRSVLASRHPRSRRIEAVVASLIGLGFTEVSTFVLTSRELAGPRMRLPEVELVALLNPLTGEYTHLRRSLLPGILHILSLSRRRDMPIRVFEVGECIIPSGGAADGVEQRIRVCGAAMHSRAGFSECRSTVESLFRDLGENLSLEARDHPSFIPGRCASIRNAPGGPIGRMGEVHPDVLVRFDLPAPVIAFEMDAGV